MTTADDTSRNAGQDLCQVNRLRPSPETTVKMSPSSSADETVTEIITPSPVEEFAPPLLLKDDSLSPPSSPSECHLPPGHRHRREHNLRLRLIVLISVAFLALTAVAAISQQLFLRHFAVQAALWNRNRRNRNFLTSGTGTGTVTCCIACIRLY